MFDWIRERRKAVVAVILVAVIVATIAVSIYLTNSGFKLIELTGAILK